MMLNVYDLEIRLNGERIGGTTVTILDGNEEVGRRMMNVARDCVRVWMNCQDRDWDKKVKDQPLDTP